MGTDESWTFRTPAAETRDDDFRALPWSLAIAVLVALAAGAAVTIFVIMRRRRGRGGDTPPDEPLS